MKKLLCFLSLAILFLLNSCRKSDHTFQCITAPTVVGMSFYADVPDIENNVYFVTAFYEDSPYVNGLHVVGSFITITVHSLTGEFSDNVQTFQTDGNIHNFYDLGSVVDGFGVPFGAGDFTVSATGYLKTTYQNYSCSIPVTYSQTYHNTGYIPQNKMQVKTGK